MNRRGVDVGSKENPHKKHDMLHARRNGASISGRGLMKAVRERSVRGVMMVVLNYLRRWSNDTGVAYYMGIHVTYAGYAVTEEH